MLYANIYFAADSYASTKTTFAVRTRTSNKTCNWTLQVHTITVVIDALFTQQQRNAHLFQELPKRGIELFLWLTPQWWNLIFIMAAWNMHRKKTCTCSELSPGVSVCERSVCPCDGLATRPGCVPASQTLILINPTWDFFPMLLRKEGLCYSPCYRCPDLNCVSTEQHGPLDAFPF